MYRCKNVHFSFVPLGFRACVCKCRCVFVCLKFLSLRAETLQCVCVAFVSRHLSVLPAGYKFTFH